MNRFKAIFAATLLATGLSACVGTGDLDMRANNPSIARTQDQVNANNDNQLEAQRIRNGAMRVLTQSEILKKADECAGLGISLNSARIALLREQASRGESGEPSPDAIRRKAYKTCSENYGVIGRPQ